MLVDKVHYKSDNPQFKVSSFTYAGIAKALSGGDIDDSSASEAIATTTSEESDDVDNENSTYLAFIIS